MPACAEALAELLGQQLGEQVVGGDVHQPDQDRQRRRADDRESVGAPGRRARQRRRGGAQVLRRASSRPAAWRRTPRARSAPDVSAVVVGQRAQLAAEVGEVRLEVGRRAAAGAVEDRPVADHRAGDATDPRVGELAGELRGGRAVAELPDLVEARRRRRWDRRRRCRYRLPCQTPPGPRCPVPRTIVCRRARGPSLLERARPSCRASRPTPADASRHRGRRTAARRASGRRPSRAASAGPASAQHARSDAATQVQPDRRDGSRRRLSVVMAGPGRRCPRASLCST